MRCSGSLLRRLLTALPLAASLAFGLAPVAAFGSEFGHDGGACVEAAGSQHPAGSGHDSGTHQASCCSMLCVPALATDDASVPPPDLMPTGAIRSADTLETGIELTGPSPPPRP